MASQEFLGGAAGFIKNFANQFNDREDFGSTFEQNQLRRQRLNKEKERLKDQESFLQLVRGIGTVMRDSVPGNDRKRRLATVGAGTGAL